MLKRLIQTPREDNGQFLPKTCPDPNCDGETVHDMRSTPWGKEPIWRCDGLTHTTENSPLIACEREYRAAA